MKKLLVALLAIVMVFSAFAVNVMADEEATVTEETKAGESLVGAFYLQGESGAGMMGDGTIVKTPVNYAIADKIAAAVKGTDRIPFYAFDKDGAPYLDTYARDFFISETNVAKAAGIDFFAYKYYAGYMIVDTQNTKVPISNMNRQLILHAGNYTAGDFTSKLKYAVVIDGDFDVAKEKDLIIENFLVQPGYVTAEDGRPVLYIEWSDAETVKTQLEKLNKALAKAVADGANPKKPNAPKTALNDDVEAVFAVILNAPSAAEAKAVEADAISWTEGSGKGDAEYATLASATEAKWANGDAVVPNVVTGFDKSLLATNPIEITDKRNPGKSTKEDVRYSRTGAAGEKVKAATPTELVEHIKKAVATTNKPEKFKAVMCYAWDDFMGGAFLAPTKTDKQYQYNTANLDAMRAYFYGKEDGMPAISVRDGMNNLVTTDVKEKTITTTNKSGEVIAKVDFDGKDLLAPAATEAPTVDATATPDAGNVGDQQGTTTTEPAADNTMLFIIIGAAAVVVIAVVVIVIVVAKKKKANK